MRRYTAPPSHQMPAAVKAVLLEMNLVAVQPKPYKRTRVPTEPKTR
jgi:hypothetical protein